MFLRGRYQHDRRYPQRLAGSYLASTLVHVLLAALVIAVSASSSQEGATESISGGSLVTLESRAPVVAQVAPAQVAAPAPHAPRIALIAHPPQVQAARQPQPPQKRELAKIVPSAPPQPSPLPQATAQPNPQPTQAAFVPNPSTELPAVPTSMPTAVAVAITVKAPPTVAPSPVPTTAPTTRPTQRPPAPTAPPTAKPQTPAPAPSPTAKPTIAPVVARATSVPSATPAPVPPASAAPAVKQGVPSPSPTQGIAVAAHGTSPTPGPKGLESPGPRAGNAGNKPGPQRPITVAPSPTPAPAKPPSSGAAKKTYDLNAKLRALLPNNPVVPQTFSYHPTIALNASMEPTPPPEVVATTNYIYTERGSGGDALVKMWVTSIHREGPALICEGWLVRYPSSSQPTQQVGTVAHPIGGGIQFGIGGTPSGRGAPIVDAHATSSCLQRGLVPFGPSPTPSP